LLIELFARGRSQADAQEWSQAAETYRQAFDVAATISPVDAECALTHLRALHRRRRAIEPIAEARARLDADPSDPQLRGELIDLTIIGTGDFSAAAELVDDSLDDATRRLVTLAASGLSVTDGADCLALARWHATLADRADGPVKLVLLRRAGHYCQQSLRHGGVAHGPTAELLAELFGRITGTDESGMSLSTGVWLDLLSAAPLEPVADSPAWQQTEAGPFAPAPGTVPSLGRFPIVVDGTCEMQVRFAGLSTSGRLGICLPAGDKVTRAFAGRNADVLGARTSRPGFSRDSGIHTLTVRVSRRAGEYTITADADGLPYMRSDPVGAVVEPRLAPKALLAGRDHLMLGGIGANLEMLGAAFKLTSGEAWWREAIADAPTRERRVRVPADQPWQWVTQVQPGDILEISAAGQWSPGGPDMVGPAGDEGGWYALRGRLLDSERTFTIGQRTTVVVTREDVLKMEMDDANKADNHGAVDVTVKVIADLWPGDSPAEGAPAARAGPRDTAEDLDILFGQQIRQVGSTADTDDDIALAEKLLAAARAVEDEAFAALLADNARQLAMSDRGGRPVAIEAIRLLLALDAKLYGQHRPTLILLARKQHTEADPAVQSAAAVQLFHVLVEAAEQHADEGRWDLAGPLFRQAQAIEDDALAKHAEQLTARAEHAAQREGLFHRKVELDHQLTRRPGSADIRRELILLNLAELNDVGAAAALVNDDVDPATAEAVRLAGRDLRQIGADEAVRLARWCLTAAQDGDLSDEAKSALLDRAWQCCEFSLSLVGPDVDIAQDAGVMFAEINQAAADGDLPGAGPLYRGEWADLLARADLAADAAADCWQRQGDWLTYYSPSRTDAPREVSLSVLPRGDYDVRVDWLQVRSGGAPMVLCPLTNTQDGGSWTVSVPVLAPGRSVTSRRVVSTEIRVRHVEGQAVIDVVTDGNDQYHQVIDPGYTWGGKAQVDAGPASLTLAGGSSTLVVSSARVRMLTGYARPVTGQLRRRWGRFRIDAAKGWQPALPVRKGDRVTISAEGAWSLRPGWGQDYICTPDGRGEGDSRWGHLVAQVGEGEEFFVGGDCTFAAEEDGMLRLRIHESPDQLHDNEGHATVTVQIQPAPEDSP